MAKFAERLPRLGDNITISPKEFESVIDSADADFIDEYLRLWPKGYRWEYVEAVQKRLRHRQIVTPHPLIWWSFGISIVAIVLTFLAWWFPREPLASGHKEPVHQTDTPTLLPPSLPSVVLPPTNAVISTTTNQVRP